MPGFLTNDLPVLPQINGSMRIPVDTEFPRGMNPASVAATALQISGTLLECTANAGATANAAGAVTNPTNTFGGVIQVAALATPPGGTYTLTVPNTLITAGYLNNGGQPEVSLFSGNNTGGAPSPDSAFAAMALQSLVATPGGWVATWMNNGQTALNGTMQAVWHL